MTDPLDLAYRLAVEDRISTLRRWRRWCRAQPSPAVYADLADEYEAELRALIAVARLARSVARTAREREAAVLARGDFYAYPAGFATISPRDGGRLER